MAVDGDQCTSLVSPLFLWMKQNITWETNIDDTFMVLSIENWYGFSFTCELLDHFVVWSYAMLVLCQIPSQAGKFPNRVSWQAQCTWKATSMSRPQHGPNKRTETIICCLRLGIEMLDTKILVPDKYVLITGDNIWVKKPFCEPPYRNKRSSQF